MIIAKYDRAAGTGMKTTVGSTAVAGGGSTVDLTPLTEKVASLESEVSQLRVQLARAEATLAGLDARFLSKFGDVSDGTYQLGAVYTDYIQSERYDDGVGFRVSGSATAAVEDKYNFIIKDVGWGRIPFTTITQNDMTVVTTNTDEDSDSLSSSFSIGETNAAGYVLLDFGAELTHERCFTTISKRVRYQVQHTQGDRINITDIRDADTDSNGYFILKFSKADNVTITVWFTWTYAFAKYGDVTSGTYRLYIRGTDYTNSRTDCFATTTKTTTVNSKGTDGARITSAGVQVTYDGGTTWTSIGGSSASFGNNHNLSL